MALDLTSQRRQQALLLRGILILLGVLSVILTLTLLQQHRRLSSPTSGGSVSIAAKQTTDNGVPLPGEPSDIRSRAGTVIQVKGSQLQFSAKVFNTSTQRFEDTDLVATLTPLTTLFEWNTAKGITAPKPTDKTGDKNLRAIDSSMLANGDSVRVYAATNIKNETSFTATEVWRIIN